MRLRHFLAAPLVAALLATGCAKSEDTGETNTTPLPAADINPQDRAALVPGGELRVAVDQFGGFNPMGEQADAELAQAQQSFLPTFFRYDARGVATPNTSFLESASETSSDPTRVRLKLNPRATWADGRQITADDVQATWRACNGKSVGFRCAADLEFDQIADVRPGASNTEVELVFAEAYPHWRSIFNRVSVLRAESVRDANTFNTGWASIKKEWTAGPFIVSDHDPAVPAIVAERNPDWWGEQPLLSRVTIREIPRENQVKAYTEAEIDAVDIGTSPELFNAVRATPRHAIRRAGSPVSRQLVFNTTASSAVNEEAVRQAIAVALDRSGVGTAANPEIGFQPAALGNRIFIHAHEGYVDNAEDLGFTRDLGKARDLLDDAGWEEADGVRSRDGRPLEVRLVQVRGLATSEGEARAISAQLQLVGIATRIVNTSLADFDNGSVLSGGAFDLIVLGITAGRDPYGALDQRYGSGAEANYARLDSTEVDGLIRQIVTEPDAAQRQQLANELDARLWELMPTTPLYQLPQSVAVGVRLANYGAPGLSSVVWENVGYLRE